MLSYTDAHTAFVSLVKAAIAHTPGAVSAIEKRDHIMGPLLRLANIIIQSNLKEDRQLKLLEETMSN